MINKVILIGNVGHDFSLDQKSQQPWGRVSLATTEKYTDKDGNKIEDTQWHNLVFGGRNAEVAEQYVRKGDKIYIEGRIVYREYIDKEGNKKKETQIRVNSFKILISKTQREDAHDNDSPDKGGPTKAYQQSARDKQDIQHSYTEDDLPF